MSSARPATAARELKRLRILHVDDDAVNRVVLDEVLRSLGHDSLGVEAGEAALASLRLERFDLVILDIHMPAMNGIVLAERILQTIPDPPPLLALTADVMTRAAPEFEALGFAGVIAKPMLLEPFSRMLTEVTAPKASRTFAAFGMKEA